jgi:hypothetical protein
VKHEEKRTSSAFSETGTQGIGSDLLLRTL